MTGCTSGIGEEMAKRFALKGFNIVLISRSLDRLKRVASEIATLTQDKVQTKIVQADFANGGEQLDMYQRIYSEVKDLDIAILVNNAGVNYRNYFKETPINEIIEMTVVNLYPYTFLTHLLLPMLRERPNSSPESEEKKKVKSALITIGSAISD